MTEDEARAVVLLQSCEPFREEDGRASPHWRAEDRLWATQQAAATLGERASPERFVVTRAALAMPRLKERDRRAARWLARRGWHPAWVLLALVFGAAAGLAVDQLGPPQRVNLLAPAVWTVVAWNLVVYAALLLPLPSLGLRRWLAGWGARGADSLTVAWFKLAEPLATARAALVLHAAAAALALGLVAGLYLRGLVLDYRAGWQSTFLDAAQVQALLGTLLAPAAAVTGVAVPDVAPLRVGPGAAASASAAPWIHLYGATLVLAVAVPRLLLALAAALRARRLATHFPLPLDTPYFESLHPLMRPGLPRAVRLLWCAPPDTAAVLFGQAVGALAAPLTLLRGDEGDELQLDPPPDLAVALPPRPAWQRWLGLPDPADERLDRLRAQCDAVLLVAAPEAPRPPWLATIGKPVIVLEPAATATAPALPLLALADGWLPDGRLLRALERVLDGDPRLPRLADHWRRRQQQRFDAVVAELAASLGRIAGARVPLADSGWRVWRSDADAAAARQALATALEAELRDSGERLRGLFGAAEATLAAPPSTGLRRVGIVEGRAALTGGVGGGLLSGALLGLKADLLSGGLTMGGGMLAGAVLGAVGGAGVARGLNVVRDGGPPCVTWDRDALAATTDVVLLRCLVGGWGLPEAAARERLAAALAPQRRTFDALWARRAPRGGDAEMLAAALQGPVATVLKDALAVAGGASVADPDNQVS